MRWLMQDGKYTTLPEFFSNFSASAHPSLRTFAMLTVPGVAGVQRGISPNDPLWSAAQIADIRREPRTAFPSAASCSIAPAQPATSERWSAENVATPRERSGISRPRITWISSPVLMPTGHPVEHNPSPAQRSLPMPLNSRARRFAAARALPSVAPSPSSLAISRCTTILWRDESA